MTDADASIAVRYQQVLAHIAECAGRAHRAPADVQLIAVSKTRSLAEVQALASLGQRDFGENTIQDALTKIPDFRRRSASSCWHFIGHLQTNKVNKIPGNFQWLHTVDNLKLAEKLSAAMQRYAQGQVGQGQVGQDRVLNCLLQVNISGEKSKSGLHVDALLPLVDELFGLELAGLRWRGLMTIGVKGDDSETRKAFADLRELCGRIRETTGAADFDQLSMGMSGDYCAAIEEGATMVRIGSSIFGPRAH